MWWACQGLFRVGSGTAQGRFRGATTPTSSPWAAPAGADGSGAGGGGHRGAADAPSPTAAEDDRSALGRRPAGPSWPQPPTARRRGGRRPPRMTGLPGAGCRAGVDMVTGSSARGRTIVHRLWTAEYRSCPGSTSSPSCGADGATAIGWYAALTASAQGADQGGLTQLRLHGAPAGRAMSWTRHDGSGTPRRWSSVLRVFRDLPPMSVWAAWTFRTRREHMECRAPGRLDRHDRRDGDRLPLTAGQVRCRARVR